MTNYHDEPRAMDLVLDDQHTGSVLQTLGWVLLVFAAIPAVWIWVGFRIGSYFWLVFVAVECLLGFSLVAAGTALRARSARDLGRGGADITAPSMFGAEQARRSDEPYDQAA
jgi:hypothetical protein